MSLWQKWRFCWRRFTRVSWWRRFTADLLAQTSGWVTGFAQTSGRVTGYPWIFFRIADATDLFTFHVSDPVHVFSTTHTCQLILDLCRAGLRFHSFPLLQRLTCRIRTWTHSTSLLNAMIKPKAINVVQLESHHSTVIRVAQWQWRLRFGFCLLLHKCYWGGRHWLASNRLINGSCLDKKWQFEKQHPDAVFQAALSAVHKFWA